MSNENTQYGERLARLETSMDGLVDELKELASEMRSSTSTQIQILAEIRMDKPRAEKLARELDDLREKLDELRQELAKFKGFLAIVKYVGFNGLCLILAGMVYLALRQ